MKTTTLPPARLMGMAAPARPLLPRPLWQRHQLFQEPAYPDGQPYADDTDAEDDTEIEAS